MQVREQGAGGLRLWAGVQEGPHNARGTPPGGGTRSADAASNDHPLPTPNLLTPLCPRAGPR